MPIYEYRYAACGQSHDALQKLSDAPLVDCLAFGKLNSKKKISAAGFRLTGSGWYETDFKTGDEKKNLAGEAKSPKPKQQTQRIPNRLLKPSEKGIISHAYPLLWQNSMRNTSATQSRCVVGSTAVATTAA